MVLVAGGQHGLGLIFERGPSCYVEGELEGRVRVHRLSVGCSTRYRKVRRSHLSLAPTTFDEVFADPVRLDPRSGRGPKLCRFTDATRGGPGEHDRFL